MAEDPDRVALAVIAREWGRIGCIGFGGPPAHIALLRRLCVDDRGWLAAGEFEDGVAAVNLLPGPASTQLAIYCAWRLRGAVGALVGGLSFIVPGLIVILALASLFLAAHPPGWVSGLALGAGAAVPAVALAAAIQLIPASWRRAGTVPQATAEVPADGSAVTPATARARAAVRAAHLRWGGYLAAGAAASALLGPWLVLVLAAAGLIEVTVRAGGRAGRAGRPSPPAGILALATGGTATAAGLAAVAWVAFKVGALSYGGGFVIIPLMQRDAVHTYHWMSSAQFLTAVALGQVTPGPVVQTVAVVGYAAAGVAGWLIGLRRGVVTGIVGSAALGVIVFLAGGPVG